MANKDSKVEKKDCLDVNSPKTNEEMEKYVNDNLFIVPRNWRKRFDVLKLEQKVEKIRFYFDIQKKKNEVIEKNKLENKIRDLFVKRKVSTEDVVKVIDFCKQYIQTTKQEEIDRLQNEIEKLTHLKQTLEMN